MLKRRLPRADFPALGYQPNPPLQRDASPATLARAPELAR